MGFNDEKETLHPYCKDGTLQSIVPNWKMGVDIFETLSNELCPFLETFQWRFQFHRDKAS
jgi:hypothetical protein